MAVLLPLILIIGTAVISVLVMARMREKQREGAFQQAAGPLGIEYLRDEAGPLTQLVGQIPMLSKGKKHTFRHVMHTRPADVDAYLAEVQYTTGSGQHQTRHTIAIAAFRTGRDNTPDFELRAENGFFHKVASAFGQHDIDFDDDPLFSDGYILKGANEHAVREFFTRERRAALAELHDKPTIESHADWLVYLEKAKKLRKPESITERIEQAFSICEPLL
jgi:hypothetical protein